MSILNFLPVVCSQKSFLRQVRKWFIEIHFQTKKKTHFLSSKNSLTIDQNLLWFCAFKHNFRFPEGQFFVCILQLFPQFKILHLHFSKICWIVDSNFLRVGLYFAFCILRLFHLTVVKNCWIAKYSKYSEPLRNVTQVFLTLCIKTL
jgi:hypothetical protein